VYSIDLARFHGIDPARLSADELNTVRYAFAAAVVDFAATCRDNRELLTGLSAAMPPESGLPTSQTRARSCLRSCLHVTRSDSAPFATLLVDVPATHRWTVYQGMGDWFAWVSIALFVCVLLRGMKLRSIRKLERNQKPTGGGQS
jgi:hypothetical protein